MRPFPKNSSRLSPEHRLHPAQETVIQNHFQRTFNPVASMKPDQKLTSSGLTGGVSLFHCNSKGFQQSIGSNSGSNQLLSPDEKVSLAAEGTSVGLEGRGIGGIADWDRLKCLHLHAAHALADVNPIGSIVLRTLPSVECPPRQVICSAYK